MDFRLSDEQKMIQSSVEKFLERGYSLEKRREWIARPEAFSRENWAQFAELGWLGLTVSEEGGGFGRGAVDAMVVLEQFGGALVVEPYVANAIVCAGLIDRLTKDDQREAMLGPLIKGSRQLAFAHCETDAVQPLDRLTSCAAVTGEKLHLSGRKVMVENGHAAETFLVSALLGASGEPACIVVSADTPGVTVTGFETIDGTRMAHVDFDNVTIPRDAVLGVGACAVTAMEDVIERAALATVAEGVGIIRALVDASNAYAKDRSQFGRPIGAFQVIQHRLVDMLFAYEQCRSLLYMATMSETKSAQELARAVSSAKAKLGTAGVKTAEQAIQIHGAMGSTDELSVGWHYKRLLVLSQLYGDPNHHLDRISRIDDMAMV